jgi:hypothetical protein
MRLNSIIAFSRLLSQQWFWRARRAQTVEAYWLKRRGALTAAIPLNDAAFSTRNPALTCLQAIIELQG